MGAGTIRVATSAASRGGNMGQKDYGMKKFGNRQAGLVA